jgi:invasion protein IalB
MGYVGDCSRYDRRMQGFHQHSMSCVDRTGEFTRPQAMRHVPASFGVKTTQGVYGRRSERDIVRWPCALAVGASEKRNFVMVIKIVSASVEPVRRSLFMGVSAAVLVAGITSIAFAQQPGKPGPAAPAPPQGTAPQAQVQEVTQLFFTPWVKVCGKGQEANAKQTCITSISSHTETGLPTVSAALIEKEGDTKILNVSVPVPVILPPGEHIVFDQGQGLVAQYTTCFPNGCMAAYEANADVLSKIKSGQTLAVEFVGGGNQLYRMKVPLADFKKVNEGPPSDPKQLEELEKKLQADLQKRADEARKRLEAQQQGAQAPK